MVIRQETQKDFGQIYDLVKVAFQTAQVSNGKEQDFVYELRSKKSYIPELALVSEDEGKLTGHIMFTRMDISGEDGKNHEFLLLAPVSVVLEKRNQGLGSALIKEGMKRAEKMGFKAVILVGNPDYYHRFGYKSAISFGIKNKQNIPDKNVMVYELVPDSLKGFQGMADFS